MATFPSNPAATPLTGAEIVPITQGGVDKRTTVADIGAAASENINAALIPFANSNFAALNVEDAIIESLGGGGGGGGTGDVVGPASSTNNVVAVFDGTTGKLLKDGASYVGQTSITTLGTIATGTWNATAISTVKGGTGQTTYSVGDLLYASSTTALSKLSVGTDGHVLTLAAGVPTWAAGGGGGGLTNWTDAISTSAPNATVPAVSFLPNNVATDVDAVIGPKGLGALLADVPNNASSGGNKRGTNAVDFQTVRFAATEVAAGVGSVIAGGRGNTAGGNYSFSAGDQNSAGGTNAVALGVTANAAGTSSVVSGGSGNTAGNTGAAVGGGATNNASATYANITGGESNTASGAHSCITGGQNSTANAPHCRGGGRSSTNRNVHNVDAWGTQPFASQGDAQAWQAVLKVGTTDNTQTALSTNSSGADDTNQMTLVSGTSYVVKGSVVARQNATGDCKSWDFTAHIKRTTNAASTAMVAACTPAVIAADAGASAWALTVDADTTNGCLRIVVTGETAKTIRWVCHVYSCVQVAG